MGQYLIDSNIISKLFSGLLSDAGKKIVSEAVDATPIISVITQIEALSWVSNDKQKEAIVKSFIEDARVLNLDTDIIRETVF